MASITTRLARRDLASHPKRSLLVLLLVALPMVALGAAAVPLATTVSNSTVGSALNGQGAVAQLDPMERPGRQCSDTVPLEEDCLSESSGSLAAPRLPGRTVTPMSQHTVDLTIEGRSVKATVRGQDFTVDGLTSFQAPVHALPAAGEVAINRPFAHRHGLQRGDSITIEGTTYRIQQVLRSAEEGDHLVVGPNHPLAAPAQQALVFGQPLTDKEVAALNQRAIHVTDYSWALNEQPELPVEMRIWLAGVVTAGGLFAALLSGSLSAAAFTVGLREQQRTLALLSATGATAGQIRGQVMRSGLLLGVVGGAAVVVCGALVGLVVQHRLDERNPGLIAPTVVPWDVLLILTVLGIGSGVLAAWLPARRLAQGDASLALRRTQAPSPAPKTPIMSLVLAAAAVALGVLAAVSPRRQFGQVPVEKVIGPALVSCVLLFAAAVLLIGWLFDRLSRWARAPLGWRLAFRDGARNRARATASTAAAMAVAALFSGAAVALASLEATADRDLPPQARTSLVTIALGDSTPLSAAQEGVIVDVVQGVAGRVLPRTRLERVAMCHKDVCDELTLEITGGGWTSSLDGPFVGDAGAWAVLSGRVAPPEVATALNGGKVVVSQERMLTGDHVTLQIVPLRGEFKSTDRPAVLGPVGPWPALMSRETAARLGFGEIRPYQLVFDFGRQPTTEEVDQMRSAMESRGIDPQLLAWQQVDEPYWALGRVAMTAGLALLAVVAGVTTALTLNDTRGSLAQLAAVGASRRTLRTMAAVQALTTTGLGAMMGLCVGAVPMSIIVRGSAMVWGMPWVWIAALVVGVPVAVSLIVWALVPPVSPVVRRAD